MRAVAFILAVLHCSALAMGDASIDVPHDAAHIGHTLQVDVTSLRPMTVHLRAEPADAVIPTIITFRDARRITVPLYVLDDSIARVTADGDASISLSGSTARATDGEADVIGGPTSYIVGDAVFAPILASNDGVRAATRSLVIVIAVLVGAAILATALLKGQRRSLLACSLVAVASVVGILTWRSRVIDPVDHITGTIILTRDLKRQTDVWHYATTRLTSTAYAMELPRIGMPVWASVEHARTMHPSIAIDASSGERTLHMTLTRDATAAVLHREFGIAGNASAAEQVRVGPMNDVARDLYPGYEIEGNVFSRHADRRGWGIVVLRPTTRPLK